VIVIVAGIVTAATVIVTDKNRILLNPALAGFFFRRFRQRYAGKAKG
jgi:Na+-transporting NADH:ubiquinone oxidoreductase subunit NqrB